MTTVAQLPHLAGAAGPARLALAAHYVRGIRHVIEIGGAHAPITDFLFHVPASVTVIDPKIAPFAADTLHGQPCRVQHIAAKFQAVKLPVPDRPYAVVMIGLSLKPSGTRAVLAPELIALLKGAETVVIEYAVLLQRAVDVAPALIAEAGLEVVVDLALTLRDGVIEHSGFHNRRFAVLKPKAVP
jgi:hypothetical protein